MLMEEMNTVVAPESGDFLAGVAVGSMAVVMITAVVIVAFGC